MLKCKNKGKHTFSVWLLASPQHITVITLHNHWPHHAAPSGPPVHQSRAFWAKSLREKWSQLQVGWSRWSQYWSRFTPKQGLKCRNVGKTMPVIYRSYGYYSQSWVVDGTVLPTLSSIHFKHSLKISDVLKHGSSYRYMHHNPLQKFHRETKLANSGASLCTRQ